MEETQIYSQRLHGITEKRRILSEVDRIQRELDQQKIKLQQLKRKSLRDRWLMDGLVPTAGVEAENPLSETEGHIKDLELQLESLQSELVYLENPQLKPLKVVKVQDITVHKELVNGERSLKQVDQNENLKEHPITEEADQPRGSHGEKLAVSQKDPTSSTEKEGRPVPAPRSKNASENHKAEHNPDVELSDSKEPDHKQTHPSQNVDGFVQKDADGSHNITKEENEIQNSGHSQELQDRKGKHQDPSGNPQEVNLYEDTVDKVRSIPNQKLVSLEKTLEQEDRNLRSPTKELDSVGQMTDDSQPMEDLNNDLFKHNENGKESLLDEITKLVNLGDQQRADQQNWDGSKPSADKQNWDGSKPSADLHNPDGGKPSADLHNPVGGKPSADQQNRDGGMSSADQQNRDGGKPSADKQNWDGSKPSADLHNPDGGKPFADQQNQDGGKPLADLHNQDGGKPSADQQNQDGGKPSADQQNQDGGKPSADQQNQNRGKPSADQQNQNGDKPSADQQNRDGDKPSISKEQLNPASQIHKSEDDGQNLGEGKFSVLINHEQGHAADEALVLSLETERAHPVLLDIQEEAEKPVAVCTKFETPDGLNQGSILHFEDQTPDSASKPLENAQSSVLPSSGQEVCTTLPCKDQIPSQSLLSEGQVNQAQISQIIVVTPSGHEQRSSNSPQGPSASNQPGTRETSTAPESQPLLQKSQETDANHGANTAEARDKSTPTKKKTCQCCVVM